MTSELVQPKHLARKAVVYVRQSTAQQVANNQESLRLQYALRQRARDLGWRESDIEVIDADLGLSGASAAARSGFKELVGRVGLGEIGLVLSIDVTRLARNCSDWYPLLDICALRGSLIADRDGVYDPASPNGRLLLGLKGTISELELHTLRSRLTAGLLIKAQRGDLALSLPIGLVRDPDGRVVKDPNIEVQQRLELVFATFLRLGSAARVMRLFNRQGLDLPRRDPRGDLLWTRATVSAITRVLKNPAYAGAFVYGRTRQRQASATKSAMKVAQPLEDWRIVVKDKYPAYIGWTAYEKIRAMIKDNRADYMTLKTRGAPRDGELLLHGVAWCARCGHKMYVRYKGGGEYVCNHLRTHHDVPTCQHIRAANIDAAVAEAFLAAVAPAEIEALSRACRVRREANDAVRSAAARQLERKRYEASLAERQYRRVDPDNRLVAGELERRWETALCELKAAEDAFARQSVPLAQEPLVLAKATRGKLVSLSGQLPAIWATATDQQRKGLLRCLIDKVILDRGEHDIAKVRIVWRGGAVSDLDVAMRVNGIAHLSRGTEMRERTLELVEAETRDEDIAAILTLEGHRSPACTTKVLPNTVSRLRRNAGRPAAGRRTRWTHPPEVLTTPEFAGQLGIPVNWLYVQIRQKRLKIDRQPNGAYLFQNTPAVRSAVRKLRSHKVECADLRICQPDTKGHQHG